MKLLKLSLGIAGVFIGFYLMGSLAMSLWAFLMKLLTMLKIAVAVMIVGMAVYVVWKVLAAPGVDER